MTISMASILAHDPVTQTPGIRQRAVIHQVKTLRRLAYSIVAREAYQRCYASVGPLGEVVGPPVSAGDEFRLNTAAGRIRVLSAPIGAVSPGITFQGITAYPEVTYQPKLEYVGLRINEPNEIYDDPYVIVCAVTLNPMGSGDQLVSVKKIGPYEDLEEAHDYGDTTTVWEGQLIGGTGLKVLIYAVDHDSGDSDDVRDAIEEKLREYVKKGVEAVAAAFGAGGSETDKIAGSDLVTWGARLASLGLVEVFDLGDDEIGRTQVELLMKEIIFLSDQANVDAVKKVSPDGLIYTHPVELRSREGRYTIYMRASCMEIPPIPPGPHF